MKSERRKIDTFSAGRYQILRLLGSGGMGQVFLATDRNLDSNVVIKIPHSSMLQDAEFAARFQQEIRSLVRLRHRNIVSIMDVGEENGVPFAVMQYLEGGSLEDRLRNGPMSEATLQQWLPDVASALDFIHREGFVHRDIKPANILFDREGNAYVSDFGVAKVIDKGAAKQKAAATMTGTGMVMGTPDYMAPELVMGERFDHRVDQYALAVTVYEILSGRRPFEGPTPAAVMVKHSTMPAPSLKNGCPSASLHAVSAVERALSKLASSRYDSCTEFCSAVLNQSLVTTPPTGSSVRSSATRAVKSQGLSCPSCGTTMRLGQQHAGKTIRCSGCQGTLKVDDKLSQLTRTSVSSGATASLASKKNDKQTASALRPPAASIPDARPQLPAALNAAVETVQAIPQTDSHRAPRRRLIVSAVVVGILILVAAGAAIQFSRSADDKNLSAAIPAASNLADEKQGLGDPPKSSPTIAFAPIPPMSIPEETELSFTAKVIGTLTGAERFYLASGYPPGMSIESDTGRITWVPGEADGPGDFKATVQITDAAQRKIVNSCQFSIRVEEVNKPPVVEPIPAHSIKSGETVRLTVQAYDPDQSASSVVFALSPQSPNGAKIDATTGEFVWDTSESNSGTYTFSVAATDREQASMTMNFEIAILSVVDPTTTDMKTEDVPPAFLTENKCLVAEEISATSVRHYTIILGSYLGKGEFGGILYYRSNSPLQAERLEPFVSQNKVKVSMNSEDNRVVIHLVEEMVDSKNRELLKENVRDAFRRTTLALGQSARRSRPSPDERDAFRRKMLALVPSDDVFNGIVLNGEVRCSKVVWRPFNRDSANAAAREIVPITAGASNNLSFKVTLDRLYFGRIQRNGSYDAGGNLITDGKDSFTGYCRFDGAGDKNTQLITLRQPDMLRVIIEAKINDVDGTVSVVFGKKIKGQGGFYFPQEGEAVVLRHKNGLLVGHRLTISP